MHKTNRIRDDTSNWGLIWESHPISPQKDNHIFLVFILHKQSLKALVARFADFKKPYGMRINMKSC